MHKPLHYYFTFKITTYSILILRPTICVKALQYWQMVNNDLLLWNRMRQQQKVQVEMEITKGGKREDRTKLSLSPSTPADFPELNDADIFLYPILYAGFYLAIHSTYCSCYYSDHIVLLSEMALLCSVISCYTITLHTQELSGETLALWIKTPIQ